jgi:hypothetical protein
MNELQNKIVGVIGRKGAGKSKRAHTLVEYAPRIIVWDPMEDFTEPPGMWHPDVFDGITGELDEYFEQANRVPTFACVVVPDQDVEADFEELCGLVYDYGNLLFVIEEAPLVCKAGYMPPVFGKIVRTGRHHNIDLCWTAQRAAEVSRRLTSMTDFFIFYSQTEPRDLDAIAERCGRDVADKVANLGLHDSFTWDVIDRQIIEDSPRLLKRVVPDYSGHNAETR